MTRTVDTYSPYRHLRLSLAALLMASSFQASGQESARIWEVPMDQALWSYSGDRFTCKLELALGKNGQLSFTHEAGGALQLRLSPANSSPGVASAAWITPPWQPGEHGRVTGLEYKDNQYLLAPAASGALLSALDEGLWMTVRLDAREIRIPTVQWQQVSTHFRDCRAELAPMSISQARDHVLFYRLGQRALSEQQLQEIGMVAEYVQLDDGITRILVDGYTDNTGSSLSNLAISRERAADVVAALRAAGVPDDIIEQRAHGERFPSANNDTPEGRDLSRRVTVRIIRQEQ